MPFPATARAFAETSDKLRTNGRRVAAGIRKCNPFMLRPFDKLRTGELSTNGLGFVAGLS